MTPWGSYSNSRYWETHRLVREMEARAAPTPRVAEPTARWIPAASAPIFDPCFPREEDQRILAELGIRW